MEAVSIPIMAKVRVGHFAEAQILQAVGVDYIDGEDDESRSIQIISGTYGLVELLQRAKF